MESVHTCDNLPSAGIRLVRSEEYLRDNGWPWKLVIQRLAEEADLENNHHLENIGFRCHFMTLQFAPYRKPGRNRC